MEPSTGKKMTLSVENLCVELSESSRRILNSVCLHVKPGQLLAVMGPSGSGKTTLLSALSGRLKSTGRILLNGYKLDKSLRRNICYVLQSDVFFSNLTLRQTLSYAAMLRLPDSMSHQDKMRQVDQVIAALDLGSCQNTIIGDYMRRGLSGGEKKRCSIACELLSNPAVMMLDEPTSSLDSCTALSLIKLLKEYAQKEQKTIVISIHQPSSQIFYQFDKLLLLSQGNMTYFGSIQQVLPHFSQLNYHMEHISYNPADFLMEVVKSLDESELERLSHEAREYYFILYKRNYLENNLSLMSSSVGDTSSEKSANHIQHHFVGIPSHESSKHNNLRALQHLHMNHNHHKEVANSNNSNHNNNNNSRGNNGNGVHTNKNNIHHNQTNSGKQSSGSLNQDDNNNNHVINLHHRNQTKRSSVPDLNHEQQIPLQSHHHYQHQHQHEHDDTNSSIHNSWSKIYIPNPDEEDEYRLDEGSMDGLRCTKDDCKWPSSFWTQLYALTSRNFIDGKSRMLSKLNWVQTIGLALIAGAIWLQVKRREENLNDIKGWMYFSTMYWMMFALFNAITSFPTECQVINKERLAGSYRLSSYYIAKMIGELPLVIALPSAFHLISYPLLGYHNFHTFIGLWGFAILNALVAQSVGMFIGFTFRSLDLCITIAALYSTSTMLFGGFYSNTIPIWLNWLRYGSIVYYGYLNMQLVEFSTGPPISCAIKNSKYPSCPTRIQDHNTTALGGTRSMSTSGTQQTGSILGTNQQELKQNFIPDNEILIGLDPIMPNDVPNPIWFNSLCLVGFFVLFRVLGYIVLRIYHKPT